MRKRTFDMMLLLLSAPLWVPVIAMVAILVRLRIGRPVLFTQVRAGLHGRAFTIIKFRTMTDVRDDFGGLLPDADRLTGFGRWLRSTSLDELPELWNVLRGDMSLVGPRPLLMDYLPLYSTEQARRQMVRPGVTGWAQINGRNAISWGQRLMLDVWYVDHRSLWIDMKIVLKTIVKVLTREGISREGFDTMPRFSGNGTE